MKKDKAWLMDKILKMSYMPLGLDKSNSVISTNWATNYIKQLDEPEITEEQAWNKIAESYPADAKSLSVAFEHFYYEGFSKKKLLVIPQFVADWYEENLSGGYTDNRNKFSGNDVFRVIQDVLKTSEGIKTWGDYDIDEKIATWAEENEEDFIHLIANCSYKAGYEVEKEPQWVVKDDTGYLSYLQFSIPNIYERETSLDKNDAYKFNSKSKADLIADLVTGTVEEVTE